MHPQAQATATMTANDGDCSIRSGIGRNISCCRTSEEMMIPSEMPSVTMGENGHGNGKNDRDDDNDDDHGKDNDLDGNQLGLPRDVHHL